MRAKIIDGRTLSSQINEELKARVEKFKQAPQLAIIMVGDDYASNVYVRNKQKAAAKVGILSHFHHFDADIKQEELLNVINDLNKDPQVNGIIVQLPLPDGLDTFKIISTISPLKDVDGFHPLNTGMLQNNQNPYFIAATPLGILKMLNTIYSDLSGKNVAIIGASLIVGRPLATLLLNKGCTVSVTHLQTKNIEEFTQNADIVVAACGCANLVNSEWIKPGAILIDVGINRDENGKICGDIDFESVKDKAFAITPVPGGVGPMTVSMLLHNTVEAYVLQQKNL